MMSTATMITKEVPKYDVQEIEVSRLDSDYNFNCRGKIVPIDVQDLIRSIDVNGLQSPIVIHEYNEQEKKITNKDYRIISGFRRFAAIKSLKWEYIPCIIKPWMPESKARVLNIEENLKRKNLNILQEAKAIERLQQAGYTQKMVSDELGVSSSWVQIRFNVLSFPQDIQVEIAKGIVNQNQIKELYGLPRDQQYEALKLIKERKQRGDKNVKVKRSVASNSKRARDRSEMRKMNELIYDELGPSFATRCLAWCSGEISSLDLFTDIKEQLEEQGKHFIIPLEELN